MSTPIRSADVVAGTDARMQPTVARLRRFLDARVLPFVLVAAGCTAAPGPEAEPVGTVSSALSDSTFFIHGLGKRCFDVGGSATWAEHSPVKLADCAKVISQKIRVRELDVESHDIALMVPDSDFCLALATSPNKPILGVALELQKCVEGVANQRFAFDGDAILVGAQGSGERVSREFVIEPEGNVTNVGMRLVVGTREASDAEYFTMLATTAANPKPTSGFVTVKTGAQLIQALDGAGWGTVIEVEGSLTITPVFHGLRAGVTLRGARAFAEDAPEILYTLDESYFGSGTAIEVGERARVTGLRMRGPNEVAIFDIGHIRVSGLVVASDLPITHAIVDHMDMSGWTGAAVSVLGALAALNDFQGCLFHDYPRVPTVHVRSNFLHDNMVGSGYGVVNGNGSYPLAQGNVMYFNSHSIAGSADGTNGYVAMDNFLLSKSREAGDDDSNADFDAHGLYDVAEGHFTCPTNPEADFCVSGDMYEMGWNTFLTTQHWNFYQRGTPCHQSFFHDNISVQSEGAVRTISQPPTTLVLENNQFYADAPGTIFGVGDFDGDGVDDVFTGTGVTWWYSPGGRGYWHFLNRMPENANELRFGDFDGDHRTDILRIGKYGIIQVSWAGISPWTSVSASGASKLDDVAVGDFDGDGLDDLFYADGLVWAYARGARSWTSFVYNQLKTPALRFGDFTGDGKTDVFFTVSGPGSSPGRLVRGGGTTPELWGPKTLTSVDGLVVGDFDGDGKDDLAKTQGSDWVFSHSGVSPFVFRRDSSRPLTELPIGHFDDNATSDVIILDDLDFFIARAGMDPVQKVSRQHMR